MSIQCHETNNEKINHIKSLISNSSQSDYSQAFSHYYSTCSNGLLLGDIYDIMIFSVDKNTDITWEFINYYKPGFDKIFQIIVRSLVNQNFEFATRVINASYNIMSEQNYIELSVYCIQNFNYDTSISWLGYSANRFTNILELNITQEVKKYVNSTEDYQRFSVEIMQKLVSFGKQELQEELSRDFNFLSNSLLLIIVSFAIEEKRDEISTYITDFIIAFNSPEGKTDNQESNVPTFMIIFLISSSLHHMHEEFALYLVDKFSFSCDVKTLDLLNYMHDKKADNVFKKLTNKLSSTCNNEEKLKLMLRDVDLNEAKPSEDVIRKLISELKPSISEKQKEKIMEFSSEKVSPEFFDELKSVLLNTTNNNVENFEV